MRFPLVTDRDYAKTPVNKQGERPSQEEASDDIACSSSNARLTRVEENEKWERLLASPILRCESLLRT
jgi:hypothetical protein